MPAVKAKKMTSTYQLLVIRQETFQFEVEAKSAEDACRKLQRNLKAEEINHTGKLMFASWSDPAEPGEAWMVMRCAPAENPAVPIHVWDGKQLSVFAKSDSTDDITQALKTTLHPKSTPRKKSKTA